MAISQTANNFMLSLKILLVSTTVLASALGFKLAVPLLTNFAVSEAPLIYNVVVSWLKPPYLYLVVNCIIITIVASSKLQLKIDAEVQPASISGEVKTEFVPKNEVFEFGYDAKEVLDTEFEMVKKEIVSESFEERSQSDESVINTTSSVEDLNEVLSDKPLVSKRFGHRRAITASPRGGKALGVSKSTKQETLENTWKTITEGRSMPLTRHLRKSDAWLDTHNQPRHDPKMIKSETFNVNSSLSRSPGGSGKLRKEPSLSQDELNRRVEAFIKKFNEDMRLQRQESLNQYREMISRGAGPL